jgi:peptide/histidine transporter 3/4
MQCPLSSVLGAACPGRRYLIALGTGGIKPCVASFGADQFLEDKPRERQLRSSFFNYFYFR